ncbi:MAG TPA: hypothetical protein VHL53_03470 [Acidimicrobiia bacterium]|nr:hypothetical protein [Acidimicrobiia bacterium]
MGIVVGIGTSHSALLVLEPDRWADRGRDDRGNGALVLTDGRVLSYAELAGEVGGRYAAAATIETFRTQAARAQAALDRLAGALAAADPDVLVVIGDDQEELFSRDRMPAVAVFSGAEWVTYPKSEVVPGLPGWYLEANRHYEMDTSHRHPGAPALAGRLIDGLIDGGVDVTVVRAVDDPRRAGFGHAFGFVARRLCRHREIPVLPVLLNTYYPPNVPRPGRCFDIGVLMGRILAGLGDDVRVGVVASGGLTHFVTDEVFDTTVLQALKAADGAALRALPVEALRSGNSEILNWVMAAGALSGLDVTSSEYIPVHRTPAGTGIGLGFVLWEPRPEPGEPS